MWTYIDGHKTYLTRVTAVCKTCELYAFIRREILSSQNSSCGFAVLDVVKAYASVFGAYTKLVYNDLDVFEKLFIRRIIRRKIRSCDRPISEFDTFYPPKQRVMITVYYYTKGVSSQTETSPRLPRLGRLVKTKIFSPGRRFCGISEASPNIWRQLVWKLPQSIHNIADKSR